MLNLEMLELLARPVGCYTGPPPPMLEDVFAKVVADGWAPRNPCVDERELARLESAMTRGRCLEPIGIAGDIVYIDHAAQPQSGDLVSFALSQRMADAQNSALPEGERSVKAGDRWVKLYVEVHGYQMLLERFGHSVTATFASCESPDGEPKLSPVRNIRRNGCLLFTPDIYASQIGANAATEVAQVSVPGPVGVSVGVPVNVGSVTVGPYAQAVTVVINASGFWHYLNAGSSSVQPLLEYEVDNVGASGAFVNPVFTQYPPVAVSAIAQGSFNVEKSFTLAANTTATYFFVAEDQTGTGIAGFNIQNLLLKAESIKR